MFSVEVAVLTDVIKHLNILGINVLYVYDALLCEEKYKSIVVETMNRIILEHGVYTFVKVDGVLPIASAQSVEEPQMALLLKFAFE